MKKQNIIFMENTQFFRYFVTDYEKYTPLKSVL